LGYENYSEYLIKNEPPSRAKRRRNNKKSLKLIGLFVLSILLIIVIVNKSSQTRWMEWKMDQYVEVKFDSKKLSDGTLKLYKEERIESFKKILPTCNTMFFNADGTENLWYGKNIQGTLEFYTSIGKHPVTGQTLKKITDYMITKYICPSYK